MTLAGGGLTLDNLAVGNKVLALGWVNAGRIDAGLVQRLPILTPGSGIGGRITNVSGSTLQILGTLVTTNNAQFFDAQGQAQNQAEFFAALQANPVVRAEGLLLGNSLTAATMRAVP